MLDQEMRLLPKESLLKMQMGRVPRSCPDTHHAEHGPGLGRVVPPRGAHPGLPSFEDISGAASRTASRSEESPSSRSAGPACGWIRSGTGSASTCPHRISPGAAAPRHGLPRAWSVKDSCGQQQSRLRRDGPLAARDLVDPPERDAEVRGQLRLADAERPEELLGENLPGMDEGVVVHGRRRSWPSSLVIRSPVRALPHLGCSATGHRVSR